MYELANHTTVFRGGGEDEMMSDQRKSMARGAAERRIVRGRRRIAAIEDVVNRIGRGVFKRIDENRELLELLQLRCPEFMTEHPWVEAWLSSHDDFFTELAKATRAVNSDEVGNRIGRRPYPRPWPGQRWRGK